MAQVAFGREITGVLEDSLRREWLCTNGLGGYACGTVAGARTRRYHGLLVAALRPPLGRTVVVGGVVERCIAGGRAYELGTQEWRDGAIDPRGHELVESFELDGTVPVWRFAVDGALLEKRVWMVQGRDTTLLTYTVVRVAGDDVVRLELWPLCCWRDHHATEHEHASPSVTAVEGGVRVDADDPARRCWIRACGAELSSVDGCWYRGFRLRSETERGLDDTEDLYAAAAFSAVLRAGETVALTLSLHDDADPSRWRESRDAVGRRTVALCAAAGVSSEPEWVRQLVLAADQFLVARDGGTTVIAGYPWFGDWGRDTFTALPGLCLATGRTEEAAALLRTFARLVDAGMVPNMFPEGGAAPEYNTVDATLWFVEALGALVETTGNTSIVDELWPVLQDIVDHHVHGTRHGIGVDPADGLLRAGETGVQLTWMDAKVDGWVVTPRRGKPVEVNALWYSALRTLQGWAVERESRHDLASLADGVAASFARFWNAARGYLYDVLDGPDGNSAAIRPNAVIAASVMHTPLPAEQIRAMVETATRELLTTHGLRSLAPGEPGWVGRYEGGRRARDAAYHQGTVWPWLMGPYVTAHLRAYGDHRAALALLEPVVHHLRDAGLGSVSEIADGDAPHTPRGCPWQAWSVAEVLRAWRHIRNLRNT